MKTLIVMKKMMVSLTLTLTSKPELRTLELTLTLYVLQQNPS